MQKEQNSDIRELAEAMRLLADALNQTNALLADARREEPDWRNLPELLTDLNRQLRMIASRL